MQIRIASLMVTDQDRAQAFYTEKLGFKVKTDFPMGQFRWLTIFSPEGADGMELVLEPLGFPPAVEYQKALYEAGIPAMAFISENFNEEYERLKAADVPFREEPMNAGGALAVIFDDTCGNWIQMVQPAG